MNLVKVKDIKDAGYFKGKYCYCINWESIVCLEDITPADYVSYSQGSQITVDEAPYKTFLDNGWIDVDVTNKINDVTKYIGYNQYLPDDDITIDELKMFRTWLATVLLGAKEYEEATKKMLQYYSKEMIDDTVKNLSLFSTSSNFSYSLVSNSTCACTKVTSNIQSLSTTECNPIDMYRTYMRNQMIEDLSEIDFWEDLDAEFLTDICKYLENIIKLNFPLYRETLSTDFTDCSELNEKDAKQLAAQTILKNLIKSFQYIRDGKLNGHRNFVAETLKKWAVSLYEQMRW